MYDMVSVLTLKGKQVRILHDLVTVLEEYKAYGSIRILIQPLTNVGKVCFIC